MADQFDSWAIVELMGHVRIAGRVTEEERFGTKLGRVDIPLPVKVCGPCGGKVGVCPDCAICHGTGATGGGFVTQYFSGSSIYRLTPCDEATARRVAQASEPAPVHQWQLPAPRTDRDCQEDWEPEEDS